MANEKTFQYFGHDIPLDADCSIIDQYAEEISADKRMDAAEVKLGIMRFQEAAQKTEVASKPARIGQPVMFL